MVVNRQKDTQTKSLIEELRSLKPIFKLPRYNRFADIHCLPVKNTSRSRDVIEQGTLDLEIKNLDIIPWTNDKFAQ